MNLIWQTVHGDLCGALPSEPENFLAQVWNYEGWRMSCAFGTTDEEGLTYGSPEAAQLHAQELIDAWVEKHTRGWKDEEHDTLKCEQRPERNLVLNARQLKALLALAAPDDSDEWMDHELIIQERGHWVSDEGVDMPPGIYALYFEQPEEGWYGPVKGGAEA
jgi:hypothetical protein